MEWARKFVKVISDMPEVIEFYRLSGSIDYLLKVLVPSIEKYDDAERSKWSMIELSLDEFPAHELPGTIQLNESHIFLFGG